MTVSFDMIYSSKVFDFTPENEYLPSWAIRGGTGYPYGLSRFCDWVQCFFPAESFAMYPTRSVIPFLLGRTRLVDSERQYVERTGWYFYLTMRRKC